MLSRCLFVAVLAVCAIPASLVCALTHQEYIDNDYYNPFDEFDYQYGQARHTLARPCARRVAAPSVASGTCCFGLFVSVG